MARFPTASGPSRGFPVRMLPFLAAAFAVLLRDGRGQGSVLWKLDTGWSTNSVAPVGDFDGDGVPDVGTGHGGFSGSYGEVRLSSGADGDLLATILGSSLGDGFGRSLAVAGDLDGDGVPDLVVGAPFGEYIRVLSGATAGTLLTVAGTSVGDRFGESVDAAGDVNGDGIGDLVVAAPLGGYARIVSGSNGATLQTLAVTGGGAVAGVGDADGDSVPDVAVGATYFGMLSTSARMFSGSTGGLLWTVLGANQGDEFGASVAGIGDADGDGLGDVVVGAPGLVFSGAPAYVSLLSGASGAAILAVTGIPYLGWSVARAGDVNGDGVPDFIAGQPAPDYSWPFVSIHSGSNGALLSWFSGPDAPPCEDSFFGRSVAVAGDVNGDGAPELLVSGIGSVYVISSAAWPAGTSLFGSCPSLPCPSTAPSIQGFVNVSGGLPAVGNGSFMVVLSSAAPGVPTVLVAGLTTLAPPINLFPFMYTCPLFVTPDFLLPTTTNQAGAASVAVPIPANPSLVGAVLHFQWYHSISSMPAPGKLSPRLQVTAL